MFLNNDDSGFDLKSVISVKKLDNSIREFQTLSQIADLIRKHRT